MTYLRAIHNKITIMKGLFFAVAFLISGSLFAQTTPRTTSVEAIASRAANAQQLVLDLTPRLEKALEIRDAESAEAMRVDILEAMDAYLELQPNADLQDDRDAFATLTQEIIQKGNGCGTECWVVKTAEAFGRYEN